MSDEYNPEGPELDDVFDMPVQCYQCQNWLELNDCTFHVRGVCDCDWRYSCRHGICPNCLGGVKEAEEMEREQDE